MKRLIHYGEAPDEQILFRGMRLQFPGSYPHEEWLQVMVYDPQMSNCGMGLLVISGQKAGLPLVVLPLDSEGPDHRAIRTDWLIKNFEEWVYDAPIENVFVLESLSPPSPPFDA